MEDLDSCVVCGRTLHSESAICPICQRKQVEVIARNTPGIWAKKSVYDFCIPRLKADVRRRKHV